MKYFECTLPRKSEIPTYYHPSLYARMAECVELVHARTSKLNEACDFMRTRKGMRPATFHALAKKVFDLTTSIVSDHFDTMSVDNLCTLVSLLDTGFEYPDREEWPNAVVLYDTAFVSVKDWEVLRHFGIGGSDSSVLMGVSHYNTEEGLFYDKVGYPELVKDEGKQAIFARGHFLEPKVIEVFCRMTGAVVVPETRMFRSRLYPHSTANLDAVLRMPSGKLAIFEAKSAIDVFAKNAQWFGNGIPANYVTQIHQYLAVMDDPRIEGVYIGMLPCTDHTLCDTYIGSEYDVDKYFHQFEERDPVYEEEILRAEDEFWKNHVETGIVPDRSRNAKLDAAIAKRFKPSPLASSTTADPITLPYEVFQIDYDRLVSAEEAVSALRREVENAENYRDDLRRTFLNAMGDAPEATLVRKDGTPLYTIKQTKVVTDRIDTKTLKTFFPEAAADCGTVAQAIMHHHPKAYEKCHELSESTRFSTKPYAPPKTPRKPKASPAKKSA